MTIVGNATAKPRSSSNKFLAELANIYENKQFISRKAMSRDNCLTCGKIVRNVLISLYSSVDSVPVDGLPSVLSCFDSTTELLLLTLYVAFLKIEKVVLLTKSFFLAF